MDKSVIPLWTEIYIDGVGWRTALDTGSAIRGNILDIWMPTLADCQSWGSRNRAVFAREALATTTTAAATTTTAAPPDTEPQ
ncbi:MAG: 3D domain-containing protein [Acidimicrobiia bacterium]